MLLQERRSRISDHPDSVATTWSLSFQRVEEKYAAAADLLRLCAYLAPDAIPEEIIIQGAQHLGSLLESVVADSFLFAQAIEVLRAYSLVSRDPRTRTLSIHRLVQAVLRDNMPAEREGQWKQRTILTVNAACPEVEDVKQWGTCERWLPHALVCAIWIDQEQMSTHEAAHLLNRAGYYLNDRGRYAEAELLLVRALSIHKEVLGPEHSDIAFSFNNLAEVYQNQGRYTEVELLYKHALSIREQQLGPKHSDTASSLSKLADLYQDQGKYELAESLRQRVHAICEQQLGTRPSFMAQNLNGLASLYQVQGKYEQAEQLLKQALSIREQQLGAEHPVTATSTATRK